MQEEREHKGLFDRVKSFIIEDVPDDEAPAPHAPEPPAALRAGGHSDDVDRMFADIEAEVGGKPAKPPVKGPAAAPVTAVPPGAPAPASSAKPAEDVLPPDVQKVVRLIDALPPVLTKEQVLPLLTATMDAANLNAQTVSLQVDDARRRAEEGIAAANQEIVRLEAEREETLGRLTKLMEAARSQCADGTAAQQARIGELTAALNTLARVGGYLPGAQATENTEKRP